MMLTTVQMIAQPANATLNVPKGLKSSRLRKVGLPATLDGAGPEWRRFPRRLGGQSNICLAHADKDGVAEQRFVFVDG